PSRTAHLDHDLAPRGNRATHLDHARRLLPETVEPREGELYGDVLVRDARGVEHREESRNLTPQDRRLRHRDTAILAQLEVADDVPECRVGEVSVRTAFVLREHGPHYRAHLGQRHPDAPSSAALGRCRRVTGPGM